VSETPSATPSATPSVGWENYSRGEYASLPSGIADLSTPYIAQDYVDVNTKDGTRVNVSAADGKYAIHQFSDYIGSESAVNLRWEGQSSQAPSISQVNLQVYNVDSSTWETVASNNTAAADTDFVLAYKVADTTNYVSDGVIVCRVYQEG
jgi:hypothetical protein